MRIKHVWWIACLLTMFALMACNGPASVGGDTTVTGQLFAPDGSTPVSNATVYTTSGSSSMVQVAQTGSCPEPSEAYGSYTCTDANGNFSFQANFTGSTGTIYIQKGSWNFSVTVNVSGSSAELGDVDMPNSPATGGPSFAVVTGFYDRMQDVLAKSGMGDIDATSGQLVLGTETFAMYDGDSSLDDATYPNMESLFMDSDGSGSEDIYDYDVVFLNCGASETFLSADELTLLRQYVEAGGKLYVTDLAYDYVEQPFPEFVDFYGSDSTPVSDPETQGAAETGLSGIETNATITDSSLLSWLQNRSCEQSDGSSGDCLNPDDTVHIAGFLSGWAVINGAHAGQSSAVNLLLEGEVTFDGTTETKPLTLTANVGSGAVLYSSYHTEEETAHQGLYPQERILQYLVFDL